MNYDKEQFKKKLYAMSGRNVVTIAVILGIAVVIFLAGTFLGKTDFHDFSVDKSGYSKVEVKYLVGPFAEYTKNEKTEKEYYLANDEYGWFIVCTDTKNTVPVYGVDVFDEDLDGLKSYTLKGNSTYIEYKMEPYIEKAFTKLGYDVSGLTTSDYVGDYYLDTTDKGNEFEIVCTIIAVILVLVALFILITKTRKLALIKKGIIALEDQGQFDSVYEDFAQSSPIYSKVCRLAVSNNYIINLSNPKKGIAIVPISSINNVFRCNMINGNPTSTTYIAVEDGSSRYYLTYVKEEKANKLDEVVSYIRSKISREVM